MSIAAAAAAAGGLQCEVWQPQVLYETPYSSSCCCISDVKPSELFIDFYVSLNEGDGQEMSGSFGRYKNFRQRCTQDSFSWSAISSMLSQTNVPYHLQPFLIQHISIRARRIASQPHNALSPTIPIVVDLIMLPSGSGRASSRASIEDILVKAVDDDDDQRHTCVICLDEIGWSEFDRAYAPVRMPCFHVYHSYCIRKWLQLANPCPLCRFHP